MTQKKIINIIIGVILVTIGLLVCLLVYQNGIIREKTSVILIEKSIAPGFEFWELVSKGALEGAKEFEADLEITGTQTEEDINGQIKLIYDAIEKKPQVIVLAAVDQEKVVPAVKKAVESNIKVVLVDSSINSNLEECFVGTDNFAGAKFLGEEMSKTLGYKGKIAIVHHQGGTATATQRINGFKEGLSQIEIVGEYDIGDSVEKSYYTALEILTKHPDLDGIYATNQISAEGVTKALELTGRRPVFFAFDSSTTQNDALEKGIITGFAVQKPFNMGYMSIKAAVEAAKGTLKTNNVDTGFSFVTKETMEEEEIQKLIYPFV